jgi:hypothetical protein
MTYPTPAGSPATGADVEHAADALEAAAVALAGLLARFADSPRPRLLDPRAVLLGMSRACDPIRQAAAELARQEWVDLGDADDDDRARWAAALVGLAEAGSMFGEVADGWI